MASEKRAAGLGVAITDGTIVAVHARYRNGRVEVSSRGAIDTPPGAVSGAVVVDHARVAQAMKTLRREMNLRERFAAAALFSPGYSMRTIRLPDVPEKEQRTIVRNELEDVAALPVGGGAFDYLWIPVPPVEGKRQADACAYYVNDQAVDGADEALRQSGMEMAVMEPSSIAMMRAYLSARATKGAVALLAASEKHVDLCIFDGENVRHVRRIPAGWADIAEASAADTAVERLLGDGGEIEQPEPGVESATGLWGDQGEFIEAQQQQAVPGAPGAPFALQEYDADAPQAALERTSAAGFLSSEITRTLAFYQREYLDAPRPDSIVVLGPHSVVRDFRRVLAMSLPVPIAAVDPLAGIDMPPPIIVGTPGDVAEVYLAAIGAAIGGATAETPIPVVDVSQQEVAARTRRRAPVVLLAGMAGSTLWMLGALVAAIALTLLESSAQTKDNSITSETKRIQTERAALLKAAEVQDNANTLRNASIVPAESILGRVAAATTPGVTVTSIKIGTDGKALIDGKAMNETVMRQFVDLLGQGKVIGHPDFLRFTTDEKGVITFTLVGVFKAKK